MAAHCGKRRKIGLDTDCADRIGDAERQYKRRSLVLHSG
jgi:hypothetical protein